MLGKESVCTIFYFFFFQAEDGIRDCLLSRGLGDVYKRQFLFILVILMFAYKSIIMASTSF